MPLMAAGLPLMKYALPPLTKNGLIPLELSVRMSAVDAAFKMKIYESGHPSDLASRTTT